MKIYLIVFENQELPAEEREYFAYISRRTAQLHVIDIIEELISDLSAEEDARFVARMHKHIDKARDSQLSADYRSMLRAYDKNYEDSDWGDRPRVVETSLI